MRGVAHDFAHRAANEVEFRSLACFQQRRDVLHGPVTDAGLRVGSYVRDRFAVRPVRVPGEKTVRLSRAEPVARCVTLTAVGERGNEVGAAIVRFGAIRRRPEWARTEKQEFPDGLQKPQREGPVSTAFETGRAVRSFYDVGPRQIGILRAVFKR